MSDDEPNAPPTATQSVHAHAAPRRLPLATVIVLAVFFGAAAWWAVGERLLPPPEANVLAVFPFRIDGADANPHLGASIADLLSRDLPRLSRLHPLDADYVLRATDESGPPDAAAARALARRIGAAHFVVGSAKHAAGRLHIEAELHTLHDSTRARAHTAVDGDTAELAALVHQLKTSLLGTRGGLR